MSPVLVTILAYVAAQLALGVWVSRRVSSQKDYLLGGRRLGMSLCAASMFATWFGAETCVGAAGEVHAHGLRAISADPFGYGVCLLLFGIFAAGKLRAKGYTTLADLFGDRFSPQVEKLVALILIPGSILWAAAQIRAFGHVFASAAAGIDPALGIAIAAGITIAYTACGGLLADVYTDLIQGCVLVGGLLVLAAVVVFSSNLFSGSLAVATASVGAAEPVPRLITLNDWAVPIAGSLFTQEIVSRAVAAKSPSVARRAALVGGGIYLVVGTVPVLLGLIARSAFPEIELGEQVLPLLSRRVLGEVGFVIFSGALVSAILSTVDSALLACGALTVRNLVRSRYDGMPPERRLRLTRLWVMGLGVVAYLLANSAESVHELVQQSSALGSAGIFVAGVCGLSTRFGGPRAAGCSVIVGACAYVYAEYVLGSEIAYLLSLFGALAGYALGALAEARVPALQASGMRARHDEQPEVPVPE